jgi:phenylacetate-coenzyme A ligase PaaK-like adenylate-forming protein
MKLCNFDVHQHSMALRKHFKDSIFQINEEEFDVFALELFKYQAIKNSVYRRFLEYLGRDFRHIDTIRDIPFLPIEFFKYHKISCVEGEDAELVFESSGSSGMPKSLHYIYDPYLYIQSFSRGFTHFFGDPAQYFFCALLPDYFRQKQSGLLYMLDILMKYNPDNQGTFYLYEHEKLARDLDIHLKKGRKVMFWGLPSALLDFASSYSIDLEGHILVETGGMKGKGEELIREELHLILQEAFNLKYISSEYGMTELLSQAYAIKKGLFQTVPWMKVLIADPYDPLSFVPEGKQGLINVIDLCNVDTCAFIQTRDIGRYFDHQHFELLGRSDHSDIRGCNLMV